MNRSLISIWPHSSHFSQASAGISSFTRSDVRGLRSFLNQAIRAIGGFRKATNLGGGPKARQSWSRNSLSQFSVARLARLPGDPQRQPYGGRAGQPERAPLREERQRGGR